MNCREVEEQGIQERYLLDRLTEPEREEFEKHYFECHLCFAALQTGLAVQEELRHFPPVSEKLPAMHVRSTWMWALASATVVVILSVGSWWYFAQRGRTSQHSSAVPPNSSPETSVKPHTSSSAFGQELARVEAPPYTPIVLRGSEDQGQEMFRKAMQYYVKRDYAGAIPRLLAAVKTSPRTPSFNFYLGACYLLTGQTESAIVSLRQTVSLGDPSYSESAHFYLAKAFLRTNDISAAEIELQSTIGFEGDHEAEAKDILRHLGN